MFKRIMTIFNPTKSVTFVQPDTIMDVLRSADEREANPTEPTLADIMRGVDEACARAKEAVDRAVASVGRAVA